MYIYMYTDIDIYVIYIQSYLFLIGLNHEPAQGGYFIISLQ